MKTWQKFLAGAALAFVIADWRLALAVLLVAAFLMLALSLLSSLRLPWRW